MNETNEAIGVLMPKLGAESQDRFKVRYSGLEQEIGALGFIAAFAHTHDSYDAATHRFTELTSTSLEPVIGLAPEQVVVVRDLTMPKDYDRPIYKDEAAPKLVHNPEFSKILERKDAIYELLPGVHPVTVVAHDRDIEEALAAVPGSKVILKPVTGQRSNGVQLVDKDKDERPEVQGEYLIQEFIDTANGDKKLGIVGTHNLRIQSVDSRVIGAIARMPGEGDQFMQNTQYGEVFMPEDLPAEVFAIVDTIHQKLSTLPGSGRNVIAIDLMHGTNAAGEEGYVVCEINRRPMRISSYTLIDSVYSNREGILWLSREWDKTESKMLADIAK